MVKPKVSPTITNFSCSHARFRNLMLNLVSSAQKATALSPKKDLTDAMRNTYLFVTKKDELGNDDVHSCV
jgi:hypothetical protein